jgi:hypothetical protein
MSLFRSDDGSSDCGSYYTNVRHASVFFVDMAASEGLMVKDKPQAAGGKYTHEVSIHHHVHVNVVSLSQMPQSQPTRDILLFLSLTAFSVIAAPAATGKKIFQSLLFLSEVITRLADNSTVSVVGERDRLSQTGGVSSSHMSLSSQKLHVPYRDSALTKVSGSRLFF